MLVLAHSLRLTFQSGEAVTSLVKPDTHLRGVLFSWADSTWRPLGEGENLPPGKLVLAPGKL